MTISCVAGIIICVPLGALSAYLFTIPASDNRPKSSKNKILLIAALLVIAIIVMPLIVTTIGLETGMIKRYPSIYDNWPVNAERIANDTIMITNGVNYRPGLEIDDIFAVETPFIIMMNGKDVTNATMINESGLSLKIDPIAGLSSDPGEKVTLTGPDVGAANGTDITIVACFRDGSLFAVFSKNI
jgi:hypothetical protein